MLETFEKAEIFFVSTLGSGLARLAETALRARLERAGVADRYKLDTVIIPTEPSSSAVASAGRPEGQTGTSDRQDQDLGPEWAGQADLIIAMSEAERLEVERRFSGVRGQVVLLGEAAVSAGDTGGPRASPGGLEADLPLQVEEQAEDGFEAILRRAETARAQTMARVGLSTSAFLFEEAQPSVCHCSVILSPLLFNESVTMLIIERIQV